MALTLGKWLKTRVVGEKRHADVLNHRSAGLSQSKLRPFLGTWLERTEDQFFGLEFSDSFDFI